MKRSPLRKRKGLERRAGLPRSTEPMRKTTLRSKGRPTDKASVAAIVERSGGVCEARVACAGARGCDPQHIFKRSKGRSDAPERLLWICRPCHDWIENHHREAHALKLQYSAKWAAADDNDWRQEYYPE